MSSFKYFCCFFFFLSFWLSAVLHTGTSVSAARRLVLPQLPVSRQTPQTGGCESIADPAAGAWIREQFPWGGTEHFGSAFTSRPRAKVIGCAQFVREALFAIPKFFYLLLFSCSATDLIKYKWITISERPRRLNLDFNMRIYVQDWSMWRFMATGGQIMFIIW